MDERSHNAFCSILCGFYLREIEFHRVHVTAMSNFSKEFLLNKIFVDNFLNNYQISFTNILKTSSTFCESRKN